LKREEDEEEREERDETKLGNGKTKWTTTKT